MTEYNSAEIARFIADVFERTRDIADSERQLHAIMTAINERYAACPVKIVARAFEIVDEEMRYNFEESNRQHAAHQRQHDEAMQIFAGLSRDITFPEACKIKAAGDGPDAVLARKWLTRMSSCEWRLGEALSDAAHAAHPDFVQEAGRVWHYTGAGKMPNEEDLIEWFQLTHPREAKRIENEIT
jgi:hypothetical protein